MKRFFIETFGCAMNVHDTEHMIAELQGKRGMEQTLDPKEADLILINTCSVREKPERKLFSEIGQFARIRKKGAKIGVCGCTASHMGEEILRKSPQVSFVLGARNVSRISTIIEREGAVEVAIDYDESTYPFESFRNSPYRALINISIGCDKQCAFCIVPHTRGEEISIPEEIILAQARKAAAQGVRELLLLGQNVNHYGRRFSVPHEKSDFTRLLRRISEVEGIERIRFTSPHPLHMDDAFLEEFAHNPKICKSLHMPLQSGSSAVLKRMRRGYTQAWFLERAARLRALCPDVAIGTDIIVGFPGESEEDFEATMAVVEEVGFAQIFSFIYSPRPHTEAAGFEDVVPESIATERLIRLQERHKQMLDAAAPLALGRVMEVLVEQRGEDGLLEGRNDANKIIRFSGDEALLGRIVPVRITAPGRMAHVGVAL